MKTIRKIKIRGIEIEMEERVCIGGCGQKFRVMKGSKVLYAKSDCKMVCKVFANHHDGQNRLKPFRVYSPSGDKPHDVVIN